MKKLDKVLYGIGIGAVVLGVVGLCVGVNMAKKRGRL